MGISFKELKKNRLTPAEKWVFEQIEGCKPETNEFGNVEWYNNDDGWLFTQVFKNNYLTIDHDIWVNLSELFGLHIDESADLLTNLLYDYTDKGKLNICQFF